MFFAFGLNMGNIKEIFYGILPVSHNIVLDLNNVMWVTNYKE